MAMDEYISREAAIDATYTLHFKDSIQEALRNLPAGDVRPVVRGKWIPDYDYAEYDYDGSTPILEPLKYQDGWQCSLCGQYMPSEENFCPNCGADMREKPAE
jgi:hypothetical protein